MGRDLFSFFSGSVCFFFAALFVGPSIAFCFWFRLGNLFFVFFFLFFCSFALFALSVFLLLCFAVFRFSVFCFFCFCYFASFLCFVVSLFFVSLLLCFGFIHHHVWCKSNFSPMQRSFFCWSIPPMSSWISPDLGEAIPIIPTFPDHIPLYATLLIHNL